MRQSMCHIRAKLATQDRIGTCTSNLDPPVQVVYSHLTFPIPPTSLLPLFRLMNEMNEVCKAEKVEEVAEVFSQMQNLFVDLAFASK